MTFSNPLVFYWLSCIITTITTTTTTITTTLIFTVSEKRREFSIVRVEGRNRSKRHDAVSPNKDPHINRSGMYYILKSNQIIKM